MSYRDIILKEGYTILPTFFTPDQVAEMKKLDLATSPESGHHRLYGWSADKVYPRKEYVHYWSEQIRDKTKWIQDLLQPIIMDVMQENYQWFCADFHVVNPGSDYMHAHIDTPYQFGPWNHITELIAVQCLIAVDDFTHENGGTRIVPGSHKDDVPIDTIGNEDLNDKLIVEGSDFIAPAGSIIIYHPRTLHSTMPNSTNKSRSALLMCAVRPDIIDSLRHYQPKCV